MHYGNAFRFDLTQIPRGSGSGVVWDDAGHVVLDMTLTSMGCPAGPMIQEDIVRTAREVNGVEEVEIELTWDPPWTPDRMSDDAKFILGIG